MGFNCCMASMLTVILMGRALGQESILLQERFPAGYQYHVSSRADLSGSMSVPGMNGQPARTLAVQGDSAVEYDERVLQQDRGPVSKTLRVYRRLDFRRKLGEPLQESKLRPAARRMVLLRKEQSEVPFSPDGPLMWSEIDRVRTDVFTPALAGLLPEQAVRVGDSWKPAGPAVQELTDLEYVKQGSLTCRLQEIAMRGGRRFARVSFAGTVEGVNEDGPNRQQLDGYFYFDLQSNHLSYLYVDGVSWMLDKDGKTLGKIEGKYVLTRRIDSNVPDLTDDSLRFLTLEPNDQNTLLLFSEPSLGVEFTYPRRWTVRKADARQITLDEPSGGGLLVTLEPPQQTPSARQFEAEVRQWLRKQSAKVSRNQPPERLGDLEHFAFEAEIDRKTWLLDYLIVRQTSGGATFAGKFPITDARAMQRDAERIARSLRLVPPRK